MASSTGPVTNDIAQVEINHPGYEPMSAVIGYPPFDTPPTLDDLAIQLHEAVNDIVMAIRKAGPK
jgi:hypothetical protein